MKNRLILAVATVSGLWSPPALAQAEVELMPDYLIRRIEADQATAATDDLVNRGQIGEAVVFAAKRWNRSEPISVCFFGGSPQLRRDIAATASEWETSTPIRFDFGDRNNPRLCGGSYNQIRIGYEQKGYWSFIGQDSVAYVAQSEQSMNLARFDLVRPAPDQFRRVVLHEFGHALGFQHEHQHPSGGCTPEFNWPAIYGYLAGPPNYWSQEKIDNNMRGLPYHNGQYQTSFDVNSIMLYSFPAQFYVRGRESICFTPGNVNLSVGDRSAANEVYRAGPQTFAAALQAASAASPILEPEEKAAIASRTALFSANKAGQARILGVVDPSSTDLDVFVCKNDEPNRRFAEQIAAALRNQRGVGRLRIRNQVYPGPETGTKSVAIVTDAGHPERNDANRFAAALNASTATPSEVVANSGGLSPWLLSVIACRE